MADPLSITLAAVTLVTALKDIVELGDKIKDSFAKVPDNLKKAKKLALEICETLHELKEFCEENNDILERNARMKKALVNLKRKLKEVHAHCAHLIPPSSEKYIGSLKVAIYLWRNGGRIEAEICELWKEVDNCYTKSTMFASLRTEAQSHTILGAVLNLGGSDRNVQLFHTPKTTISKPLSYMDEHMAADIYLKVQVHKLTQILNKFSIDFIISNLNQQNILSIPQAPISYVIDTSYSSNRSSLYQGAVQHTFLVQDLFQSSSISSILKAGIEYLHALALQLEPLGMLEEAAHTQSWVVRLRRILVSQDPQNHTPHLIHDLWDLSVYNRWSNNIGAAYNAIEECVALSQQLQNPSASIETRVRHVAALTQLYDVVNIMGNSEQSSTIIQQAIRTYEDAFDINNGLDDIPNNNNLSPTWFSRKASHADIFQYAKALHALGSNLQQQGSIQDSFNAEMKALSILHNIGILNPDSPADLQIAAILYKLASSDFQQIMSMDQTLLYLEQCIFIRRKYVELNPTLFGKDLCYSLWRKAEILLKMEQKEAAHASINEAAKLAPRLVNDDEFITEIKEEVTWYLEEISHH